MSSHTPGPWVYRYFSEDDAWCIGYPGADGMIAMAVPNEHLPTTVSAEANAHLIAAAPELLEALKGLLYVIRNDQLVPESVSYMQKASAVLAKIEAPDA